MTQAAVTRAFLSYLGHVWSFPLCREPDQRSSWWWHELDRLSADAFLGHGCLLWACTFAPHSGRRDWSAGSVALALSPAGGSSVSLRAGCFRAANTARSTATVSCVLCHRQRMDRWASLPLAQGCHLPRLMQMSPGGTQANGQSRASRLFQQHDLPHRAWERPRAAAGPSAVPPEAPTPGVPIHCWSRLHLGQVTITTRHGGAVACWALAWRHDGV